MKSRQTENKDFIILLMMLIVTLINCNDLNLCLSMNNFKG